MRPPGRLVAQVSGTTPGIALREPTNILTHASEISRDILLMPYECISTAARAIFLNFICRNRTTESFTATLNRVRAFRNAFRSKLDAQRRLSVTHERSTSTAYIANSRNDSHIGKNATAGV